jgi:hypothetical protein
MEEAKWAKSGDDRDCRALTFLAALVHLPAGRWQLPLPAGLRFMPAVLARSSSGSVDQWGRLHCGR